MRISGLIIKVVSMFIITLMVISMVPQENVVIDMGIYQVIYSEKFQQPLRVDYEVLCYEKVYSRKGMDFRGYVGVNTSDNSDYRKNVWDKGHIAPAADFNCDRDNLRTTFSYLNCALQHEGLNRGPWKDLERYERTLLKRYGKVMVTVIIHFDNDTTLPTGAKIPSSFTKMIMVKGDTITYLFPNKDLRGTKMGFYKVRTE